MKSEKSNCKDNFKLLGFRSGKAYKKIISVLYLICACVVSIMFIATIQSEVDRLIAIEVPISLFAPYIFLSDFGYRKYLPLFKKHKPWYSFLGLILVYLVINIVFTILHPDFNL